MSASQRTIRIGTRGSPLALAQAKTVQAKLAEAHPSIENELVIIKTSGDWNPSEGDVRLSEADGGKGQFAKEIEQALLVGEIDAAVHSMKDMDSHLPDGLILDHMLEREDARDALLLRDRLSSLCELSECDLANFSQLKNDDFEALSKDTVVGTASVRRAAFLLSKRPDLKIVPFRGNVQTRIDKLRGENSQNAENSPTCTLLAMAGLNRLGIADEADVILEPEVMLPAAAQGAVGVELRKGDDNIISIFSHISDLNTVLCVKAEREVLRVLDGSCHTPIGAYAVFEQGEIWLRVRVVSLDGQQSFEDEIRGPVETIEEAVKLGHEVGQRLKKLIPPEILTETLGDG